MDRPCEWPLSFVECTNTEVFDNLSTEDKGHVTDMATNLLWHWSGRKFGLCPVTIRPCREECPPGAFLDHMALRSRILPGLPWRPVLVGGEWFNVSCGNCHRSCRCTHRNTFPLPTGTTSVQDVTVDGTVLDASEYYVERQYKGSPFLVRREGFWPLWQDLSLPDTEPDTWSITLTRGNPVPIGGQIAAGLLAVEVAKALCKDSSCQLPSRMQTVTRQGVTVAVLDTMEDIDKGKTGIYLVDSWLASVTKSVLQGGAVYSVDVKR